MTHDSGTALVLTPDGPVPTTTTTPTTTTDAAYIIYTSGSTGTPKGVTVPHTALTTRTTWMRDNYQLGPGDQIIQFASHSFDTHIEEIFPALASGATIKLLPDGPLTLTDHLTDTTVLDLPTAYWHHLVDDIDHTPWPTTLRLVILGGEQAQQTALTRWHHHFGNRIRLINTYGPTEATVIATAADLTEPDTTPRNPPIGRPIANTHITLLGPHNEPVPPGTPGELCVSGPGLATGYHNRPDLTTQRFPTLNGTRHYRTGDRARLHPDGHLEYLGRLDHQIKLRGYRIEPGEIEAHLQGRGAIAIHNNTLVAYTAGPPDDLPATLHKTLPPHLVPTLWIELDLSLIHISEPTRQAEISYAV
ncbi:AMP-binding protein, partial [Streptomyces sp. NRRL F-5123]|uniref:AMP-binding protein n=1 Tax=Streptomyces sp. NRRL F-5123 TaxID=1463856 RepID=UPI001F382FA3